MTAVPMAGAGDNGNDPVSALADLFDVMDGRIRKTDALARRSESNRLSILYVHALFALLIAPTFAALGKEGMTSSIWALIKQMPGTPGSLALIMFLGGLILAIATTLRDRVWEMVGLGFLIMWYGTISFSFAVGIIVWLLGGGDGPRPGLYAPLVYAHFAVIMLVHCNTLRRMMVASGRYG
jgi:hypothetical protein